MALKLYPHQKKCVESILEYWKENQFTLFVGPTGLGKTEILMGLSRFIFEHRPKAKILFLVNRKDLLEQTASRFEAVFPMKVGRWFAKEKTIRDITISTVQSSKSLNMIFNIIFLDEAHNIDQEKGVYKNVIDIISKKNPDARFVACTATPYREGEGEIFGPTKWFNAPCFKCDLSWAIKNKYLCDYSLGRGNESFKTDKLRVHKGEYIAKDLAEVVDDDEKVKRQVADALERLEGRKCILWATTHIAHAEKVSSFLNDLGESAAPYHSKLPNQKDVMRNFKNGIYRSIVNVAMLNEGFDYPSIDAVVIMRPTRSARLYVQMCGRGLRISEGKKDCLILDYGNVVTFIGDIKNPILPGKKGGGIAPTKQCSECENEVPLAIKNCPYCDHEFRGITARDFLAGLTAKAFSPGQHNFTADMLTVKRHISRAGNECVKFDFTSVDLFSTARINSFSKYFLVGSRQRLAECKNFYQILTNQELEFPLENDLRHIGEFDLCVARNGKYWDVQLPTV